VSAPDPSRMFRRRIRVGCCACCEEFTVAQERGLRTKLLYFVGPFFEDEYALQDCGEILMNLSLRSLFRSARLRRWYGRDEQLAPRYAARSAAVVTQLGFMRTPPPQEKEVERSGNTSSTIYPISSVLTPLAGAVPKVEARSTASLLATSV